MSDYDKIKEFRNTCSGFPRFMRVETTELREGYAKAVMPIRGELLSAGSAGGGPRRRAPRLGR